MKLNGLARPHRQSVWTLALLSMVLFITPALAAIATFEIEPQDLSGALKAFAVQSHREIFFAPEVARGRTSQGVKGKFDDLQALNMILQGTGLNFSVTASNAILVRDPAGNADASREAASQSSADTTNSKEAGKQPSPDFRVAQVDQETAGPRALTSEQNKKDEGLSEIVVTGSHIRGELLATNLMSISRDDFQRGGYTTVQDVFRNLPENFGEISPAGSFIDGASAVAGSNQVIAADGISLRGLGPGSTLVLLDGKRRPGNVNGRVFDISAIPLSVIERVDVVMGGNSAIYGSDAVAGVVNLITRKDFEGAETQAGFTDSEQSGGTGLQFSQLIGKRWERGGFVLAFDFARQGAVDLATTGIPQPAPFDTSLEHLDVTPKSSRSSAYLSGHFSLTDHLEIYANGLFARNRKQSLSGFDFGGFEFAQIPDTSSQQYSEVLGLRGDIGNDWSIDASVSSGEVKTHEEDPQIGTGFTALDVQQNSPTLNDFSINADGPLVTTNAGPIKMAVGAEVRRETLKRLDNGATVNDLGRTAKSAYAELAVPLLSPGTLPAIRRLEASLAVRYDDYSDFGRTTNPQFGLVWAPLDSILVRGAYSRAFRAPDLFTLTQPFNSILETLVDPSSNTGTSPTLTLLGGNSNLSAEKARTWSFGVDFMPTFAPGTKMSLSYFNINYRDRIDVPASGSDRSLALAQQGLYPGLIDRAPNSAVLNGYLSNPATFQNSTGTPFDPATQGLLSVFPNLVVFDNRFNNIAVESVSGVDLLIDSRIKLERGDLQLGLNSTYTLQDQRSVTVAVPASNQLDRPGKPLNFRARAHAGWDNGPVSIDSYLNYVRGYNDPFLSPPGRVASWTTLDLSLRVDLEKLTSNAITRGLMTILSAQNVLGRDPPRLFSSSIGLGYDAANANALGRVVGLQVVKRW